MFDLARMKKALEGPIVMVPPGIPRELRRKWVKVMHKGTPINEFIDKLCEDDPDFKQVLEATRKKMYEDGTMDKLKAHWANPDNHIDITHLVEPERCIAQEFIRSLPDKLKNEPIMISCPCSRCTPRM